MSKEPVTTTIDAISLTIAALEQRIYSAQNIIRTCDNNAEDWKIRCAGYEKDKANAEKVIEECNAVIAVLNKQQKRKQSCKKKQ